MATQESKYEARTTFVGSWPPQHPGTFLRPLVRNLRSVRDIDLCKTKRQGESESRWGEVSFYFRLSRFDFPTR